MVDRRFGNNRNSYRRVVPYKRQPPKQTEYIGLDGNITTINRNLVIFDRDYFIREQSPTAIFTGGEYEEKIVSTDYVETLLVTFDNAFSSVPIVVIDFYPTGSIPEVYVEKTLTAISVDKFRITFSSEFSGSFVYRAVNSPMYPVNVERTPSFPGQFINVSPGSVTLNQNESYGIMFESLGGVPDFITLTTYDPNATDNSMVYTEYADLAIQTATVNFSAPYSNDLNFIAFKT